MTGLVILALLACNLYFAKKLLSRDNKDKTSEAVDVKDVESAKATEETPPSREESVKKQIESNISDVIGASSYDPETYRNIVKEVVKEIVPLIIEEYGNFADAGLPEQTDKNDPRRVPDDKLDDVFSNKTVSDLTGEEPDAAEPRADGLDFNDMNTTMKVIKGESEKPEDIEVAKETLKELEGTTIKEQVSLDPNIRKRIMLIELHLPKSEPEEDAQDSDSDTDTDSDKTVGQQEKPKKILFHADIDTTDIDGIDLNVIH